MENWEVPSGTSPGRRGKICMKTIFKSMNVLLSLALFVVAACVAYVAIPYFGNQALIVRSGSMAPAIDVGSIVVVHTGRELVSPIASTPLYQTGDIIAFHSVNDPRIIITHRVVDSKIENNSVIYRTKGDANNSVDGWAVPEKNILGKEYFVLPWAGNLLAFAKSRLGFPLLIIIPAIFVIILEIFNIVKEIRKGMKRSIGGVSVSDIKMNGIYSSIHNVRNFNFLQVLIPLLILGIVIPITFAFSSDSEKSTGNIFAAAKDFSKTPSVTPTQTPTSTPTVTPTLIIEPTATPTIEPTITATPEL
jgi:signal peptidase I